MPARVELGELPLADRRQQIAGEFLQIGDINAAVPLVIAPDSLRLEMRAVRCVDFRAFQPIGDGTGCGRLRVNGYRHGGHALTQMS